MRRRQDLLSRWAVLLLPPRHDLQRPIRQRALKLKRLLHRRRQPKLALLLRRQDHWHRLRVNRAHLGVGLRCQKGEEFVGRLALTDLPYRRPPRRDPSEEGDRPALIKGKPDGQPPPVGQHLVLGK